MFSLKDKIILLTGAAGHLGKEMARGIMLNGGHVLLNGRNVDKLNDLHLELQAMKLNGDSTVFPFDINDESSVVTAIEKITSLYGHLDGLVNNAYSGQAGNLETSTDIQFRESYETSVVAAARLTRMATGLLSNKGGSVVNVSSMYGVVSPDQRIYESPQATNPPFYGAAKAALIQLTRYMACELAAKEIRVNSLVPGPFPAKAAVSNFPDMIDGITNRVPMQRIGKAEEIAGPVVFLLSDASSYMTGSSLVVDGGWTAR